ncbi:restriction endonuclease subunit S [Armatimonas sp.]|uniref:restriction endonuclease subunit S n=1 Tax=Armatimonas sp. TaxID=1872638 RepID=UPI00286D337F|nr:restriction endonuclease subunit S [Armatimonas sp.]
MIQGNFSKYENYKNSGIEWIEEVPEHWEIKRLKEILSEVVYGTSEKTKETGKYEVLGMGDIDEGKVSFPQKRFIDDIPNYLLIKRGDLLFNRTNSPALVGKVGLVEVDTHNVTFASYLIRLRVRNNQHDRYFWYFLNSELFISYSRSNAIQTANQANLSSSKLKQFKIIHIPLSLQKAIADYLDAKTALIDQQIDLLKQKANQYSQLKQSLINETVTRGLDKSVPMKDSGVEWIGEVPEHWIIKRHKDIFTERGSKGYPDEPLLIASQDRGVVLKNSYDRHTMTIQKDFDSQKLVKINDFVISLRSFEGGIEIAHNRGIISAAYTVFYKSDPSGLGYYKYLFKSKKFISFLATLTTGIREGRNINYQQLKRDFIPVPPIFEQVKITNYLNEKINLIEQIIINIDVQITKLVELRKTLINDVITGKIKVTKAAPAE